MLLYIETGGEPPFAEREATAKIPRKVRTGFTFGAPVLQLHPHVTVVVDEAAAAQLGNAEFYRYALKHKPVQEKY